MESKKIKWNKILNYLIISVCFVLASVFFGICFIKPTAQNNVNAAQNKAQVLADNVNFVSAKTKIRKSSNYEKVRLFNKKGNSFYSYQYSYNNITNTKLYYKADNEKYDSSRGDVSINNLSFDQYDDTYRKNEFIPLGVTHYDNSGKIEEILYDEFDDNDFVMLNNHESHVSTSPYNVENIYLSFGTPYEGQVKETAPLHELVIEEFTLINSDGSKHNLVYNTPIDRQITNEDDGKTNLVWYFYQYLDLNNLYAYNTSEELYSVENAEGLYTLKLHYIKYNIDNNGNLVYSRESTSENTDRKFFEYSFYVLDSDNYTTIPTIDNATLGSMAIDSTSEYFYNFTDDTPTLTYNPQRMNISYARENREFGVEDITSQFSSHQYTIDNDNVNNKTQNYYKITLSKTIGTKKLLKDVYILEYLNEDKNLLEYIYLSNNTGASINATKYSDFLGYVNTKKLNFEYKITKALNIETESNYTKYTTNTYKTTSYDKYQLSITSNLFGNLIDSEYIKIDTDNNYYYYHQNDATRYSGNTVLANIENKKTLTIDNAGITDLQSDGVYINKETVTIDTSATEVTNDNFKYQLINDNNNYIIEKTYSGSVTKGQIPLDTTEVGTKEVVDTIDKNFSIEYTVVDKGNGNKEISSIKIHKNVFKTDRTKLKANTKILDYFLTPNEIHSEITYEMSFDTLGVYDFNFSYATIVSKNQIVNNTTNSTNILNIKDFDLKYVTSNDGEGSSNHQDLILSVSGKFNNDYHVTLNGRIFRYINSTPKKLIEDASNLEINITNGRTEFSLPNNPSFKNLVDKQVEERYIVDRDSKGNLFLQIDYKIGTISTTITNNFNTVNVSEKTYLKDTAENTKVEYTLDNAFNTDFSSNTENWLEIITLINNIKEHSTYTTTLYKNASTNLNNYKLHIFGTTAYFNQKESSFIDNLLGDNTYVGYYDKNNMFDDTTNFVELKNVDNRENTNFVSDFTKTDASSKVLQKSTIPANFKMGFSRTFVEGSNRENLIVSDIPPISWKNLSTLLYDNKVSESYIYRYPVYKHSIAMKLSGEDLESYLDTVYSNVKIDRFTLDTYCQLNGLYEIVVLYQYEDYKHINDEFTSDTAVFYQLFTFAVDITPPEMTINVETGKIIDEETKEVIAYQYEEKLLNGKKYTNKNIEISWDIPTIFMNDIYLEIRKTGYGDDTVDFTAIARKGSLSNKYGILNITTDKLNNKYRVTIEGESSGNYEIILHYGSGSESAKTSHLIIDKNDIDNLSIYPVIQNEQGVYEINNYINYDKNSQIINYDFTFRYDAKESGAKIYTYWYKIDLTKAELGEYEQLLNINGESAITTDYKINGSNLNDFNFGNQYIYNYKNTLEVSNTNYFSNTNSCIYLFKMADEAGNERRYVVFYDTTTPKHILTPQTSTGNNIVNDDTKVIFGDYKAILINTPNIPDYNIDTTIKIDDTTKLETELDNLQLSLGYINNASTSNKFNQTKLTTIGGKYYLLLPIDSVTIKDLSSLQTSGSTDDTTFSTSVAYSGTRVPSEYYFLATDPFVNEGKISLPIINNGILDVENRNEVAYTNKQLYYVKNTELELVKRFFDTTNYDSFGAIGEGRFIFQIYDKLGNVGSDSIWMNFDKTKTYAYGLFSTTTDNIKQAKPLLTDEGSFSAAQLFISSNKPSTNIHSYELTYKFYDFNTELYESLNNDYKILSMKLLNDKNSKDSTDTNAEKVDFVIKLKETYLQINYIEKDKDATDPNITIDKSIIIQLTDEVGNTTPQHSYPYDLEGVTVLSDKGVPLHVYNDKNIMKDNGEVYEVQEGTETRIFSQAVNLVSGDTTESIQATQQGLYIFKRSYDLDLSQEQLGRDTHIKYYVYYIDRTGIINIATANEIAENLYNLTQKQNFGFILGSNYSTEYESQKRIINSDEINKGKNISTNSNDNHNSLNLFSTNKINVQFNLTADKYNYQAFYESFYNYYKDAVNDDTIEDTITKYFDTHLFNYEYYNKNVYKLNLSLLQGSSKTSTAIINENDPNLDDKKKYNTTAINKLLDLTDSNSQYSESNGTRLNSYSLFANNPYYIILKDNCGYEETLNGNKDFNYLANELDISFKIAHTAPVANAYGKDYSEDYTAPKPNDEYQILTKYIEERKLVSLALESKYESNSSTGKNINLYSTNNETLIFTFNITNNKDEAQIDPNNLVLKRGTSLKNATTLFEIKDGTVTNNVQPEDPNFPSVPFITSTLSDGTKYYALIVFDNNLDTILNDSADKKTLSAYRLLNREQNIDNINYYFTINYIGAKSSNYIDNSDPNNIVSFGSSTYEIKIDRQKPTYNLVKLMTLDKYVYNSVDSSEYNINTQYNDLFEAYKSAYNFEYFEELEFERSKLENYFFSVDYRQDSTFVFEKISEFDSDGGIYIRNVSPNNYKFSLTPDDYIVYNEASYIEGHPLFTPSRAINVDSTFSGKIDGSYYFIPYSSFNDNNIYSDTIKLSNLVEGYYADEDKVDPVLEKNKYYEIIEKDEAGNYRVYAIYVPDFETNIKYQYQMNESSLSQTGGISANTNNKINIGGISFEITSYTNNDYFLKTIFEVKSEKLNERLTVFYDPYDMAIYVKDRNNKNHENTKYNVSSGDRLDQFRLVLNDLINKYNTLITKDSAYTSTLGHSITLTFVDRIGLKTKISNQLEDYMITFNFAGSIINPIITPVDKTHFKLTIPKLAPDGTTYIKSINAYVFKNGWTIKDPDDSDSANSFRKSEYEFMTNGAEYILASGVYKFELTDNFDRKIVHFYEYNTSSTQVGGNLKFSGNYVEQSDGYNYTAKDAEFVYDNSVYDIYIKFVGDTLDEEISYPDSDTNPKIVFNSKRSYTNLELEEFGITISTIDTTSTITFRGVTELSKYHIKVIPAKISAQYDYFWNDESRNSNLLVYDKKIAIYTAVQDVVIKNLNGNTLTSHDKSEHLHLTEDFEVTLAWTNSNIKNRLDFGTTIELVRIYTDSNGNVQKPIKISDKSSYIIKEAGEYTATAINALGSKSESITFTRGEGEISMYSVYNVNKTNKTEKLLTPSAKVDSEPYQTEEESRTLIVFNYYTTIEYFNFKDTNGKIIELSDIENLENTDQIKINKNANTYLDVRVNSNLSIYVELFKLGFEGTTPFAEFRIFSENAYNEVYSYRLIKIYFLENSNYTLANTTITTGIENTNIYQGETSEITRTDKSLIVTFSLGNNEKINNINGNTIYIDRYYGDELIETLSYTNINDSTKASFTLTQVGYHKFVVRDLAGRTQTFGTIEKQTLSNSLKIYLINQILFTVNNESPINEQVFNEGVNIEIISELQGKNLFITDSPKGITVKRNGSEILTTTDLKLPTFTEPGYYTVEMIMDAVAENDTNIAIQEIHTVYKFTIVDPNIALNSFNISKSTGFIIEKVISIQNEEKTDITKSINSTDSILWLSYAEYNNTRFEITLKLYDTNLKTYRNFTFNVWINKDTPVIISSIPNGTSTKDTITLDFNPGMIYSQVGKCKIYVNDQVYLAIDENSDRISNRITINSKGTYEIKIIADNGDLISSYKFTKANPINKTTQIVLISVACGMVLLVVLFLLVRRKGKYR